MELGSGEDWVQRITQKIVREMQLHKLLLDAQKHFVGQTSDGIVRKVQLLQW